MRTEGGMVQLGETGPGCRGNPVRVFTTGCRHERWSSSGGTRPRTQTTAVVVSVGDGLG